MPDAVTTEPQTIRAGDTISWKISISDYPASSYTLSYRLINGANTIDITASADGTDHLVSISAATSAAYVAGEYTWYRFASTPTERYTIGQGTMRVLPDAATATEFRSSFKIALDSMETAIATFGNKAWTNEYQIAGRLMRFKSNEDFIKFYEFLKGKVDKEDAAERINQSLGSKRRIGVRFVNN